MNPKLKSAVKWFFLTCGVLSFTLLVFVAGAFALRMSNWGPLSKSAVINRATEHDVRYVLNWCRLGEARTEAVVHSYVSPRSFTGDHVDAYAIKVRNLTTSDLPAPADSFEGGWVRGDQLDTVTREAISLATRFIHPEDVAWFPSEEQLTSSRYYVWVWRIVIHGRRPAAAQLIFARPEDSMLFYSSVKT